MLEHRALPQLVGDDPAALTGYQPGARATAHTSANRELGNVPGEADGLTAGRSCDASPYGLRRTR